MHSIKTALIQGYKKLFSVNINSAHLDAELLLSFVLHKSREYILAHSDKILINKQADKFNNLIKQRAKHIPVAYLIHEKEFYGRTFYVDERVLVPRPETEQIIEEFRNQNLKIKNNTTIVDVGTGSGCIIITLVKELEKQKNIKFFAIDISKDALIIARKNARLHDVSTKITFLQGSLLEPILKNKKFLIHNSEFLILANLPYLTPAQIKNSPFIKHEPRLALTADKDGLKYYRKLAKQIQNFYHCDPAPRKGREKQSRHKITLICEIDPAQVKGIKKIFSFAKSTETKKDLAGLDRIVVIKF